MAVPLEQTVLAGGFMSGLREAEPHVFPRTPPRHTVIPWQKNIFKALLDL